MSSSRRNASRKIHRTGIIVGGTLMALAVAVMWISPDTLVGTQHLDERSAHAVAPSKIPRLTDASVHHRPETTFPSRTWSVPADFIILLQGDDQHQEEEDPFAPSDNIGAMSHTSPSIREALKDRGVSFPHPAFARFDLWTGTLEVRNNSANLDLIDEIIAAIGPMDFWVMDPSLFQTNDPPPDPRIEAVAEKLKTIIIPEVDFEATTFGEAITYLEQRSRELDPERVGVRLQIMNPPVPPADHHDADAEADHEAGLGPISIESASIRELRLHDVPLVTVLQYMMDTTGIRYRIDAEGVTILSISDSAGLGILTREWRVAPVLIKRLRFPPLGETGGGEIDPFAPDANKAPMDEEAWHKQRAGMPLIDLLKDNGISFPPQAEVRYSEPTATFMITNTPSNLDLAEAIFTQLAIEESKARAGL